MDLEQLRDNVRAYLRKRAEKTNQPELAKSIGVSHSWFNKFLRGSFQDLSVGRLNKLAKWVENDRRGKGQTDVDTSAEQWG